MKRKKLIFKKNKRVIIALLVCFILIIAGVGYMIWSTDTSQNLEEVPVPNPNVIDSATAPANPDASVIFTDDGFLEQRVEFKTPNDPANATILIANLSSASATFTVTDPDGSTTDPIQIQPFEDSSYFGEFGQYIITHTESNSFSIVDILNE